MGWKLGAIIMFSGELGNKKFKTIVGRGYLVLIFITKLMTIAKILIRFVAL
jgi:hypothetical protein